MPIDTAEKRRSAGDVAFLPLTPGVTPNAAADSQWRQQSAWSYSGIAAGPPTPGGNVFDPSFGVGQRHGFVPGTAIGGGGW